MRPAVCLAALTLVAAGCGGAGHRSSLALAAGPTTTAAVSATTTTTGAGGVAPTTDPAGAVAITSAPRVTAAPRTSAPAVTMAPAPTAAPAPPSTAKAAPTTTAAPAGTVVSSTDNASYGEILVDAAGRTLYLFTPDDGSATPTCTGSCASTWPPLKASGTPHATGQAKQSLLGTESGQVTYNGHPLYTFSGDSAPGQTYGEGSGGIWYVVSVNGSAVVH